LTSTKVRATVQVRGIAGLPFFAEHRCAARRRGARVEDFRDLKPSEIADVLEIRDLFARYLHLQDIGDKDGWISLFSEDCEFVAHGRTWRGKAGAAEMLTLAAPDGVHLAADPVIRVNGDRATSSQSFLAVHADRTTLRIGWYDDDLVRENGRWRLASRRVTFVRSNGTLRPPL
jgi:hypothetical protein